MNKKKISSTKFWDHFISPENTLVSKILNATVLTSSWKTCFSNFSKSGFSFLIDKGSSIKPLISRLKLRITNRFLRKILIFLKIHHSLNIIKLFLKMYQEEIESALSSLKS